MLRSKDQTSAFQVLYDFLVFNHLILLPLSSDVGSWLCTQDLQVWDIYNNQCHSVFASISKFCH